MEGGECTLNKEEKVLYGGESRRIKKGEIETEIKDRYEITI